MPTRSTITLIFTIAALVGLGTTVYTVATMKPAVIPTIDELDAATARLREHPYRNVSWSDVTHALMRKGDVVEQAELWLASLDPAWVADNGAEALIWYWISDALSLTTDRANPDYQRAEAVEARAKAIDLLIDLSLKHPDRMRYWHWNSLAWAGVRSGRYDLARGALERTQEAISSLPADFPASELRPALERQFQCLGREGLGDTAAQRALFQQALPLLEKHGEDWSSGFTYPWVAKMLASLDDPSGALEAIARAEERYESAMGDDDMRLEWSAVVELLNDLKQPPERVAHALDQLSRELAAHGQSGRQNNWNSVGWDYLEADQPEKARDAWEQWRRIQETNVRNAPTALGLYNLACANALLGDADAAVAALEQAIDLGWTDRRRIEMDRDLELIRDDPRVEALIAHMMERFYQESLRD